MKNQISQLTDAARMLAFSYMADHEGGKAFSLNETRTELQSKCQGKFNDFLNDEEVQQFMGLWSCKHEPWIDLLVVNDKSKQERNLTAVFESTAGDTFVVAVAGTNFINNFDWFTEDLKVQQIVPWNLDIVKNGAKNTGQDTLGVISYGTADALRRTWNIMENEGDYDPKTNPTPIDYLKGRLQETDADQIKKTIYVTGHSLGGAISPVLALAIIEHLPDWDISSEVEVHCYPFAGATPGDSNFVDHFERSSVQLNSFYNEHDVVPHAWQINMIWEISDLYESAFLNTKNKDFYNAIVERAGNWLCAKSNTAQIAGYIYSRWGGDDEDQFPTEVGMITEKMDLFASVFSTMLLAFLDTAAKDSLKSICEVENEEELLPYLNYFSMFLLLLAYHHIKAYEDHFYPQSKDEQGKTFEELFKNKLGTPWFAWWDYNLEDFKNKIGAGFGILSELFKELGEPIENMCGEQS